MSIEPPASSRPREISVTEPVTLAYEHVKAMLFRPFDLGRWFVIGFCAWLAYLGESGGGGGGFNNGFGNQGGGQPLDQIKHSFGLARDFVMANLGWLVPVAALIAMIMLGLGLLIIWLNCRGKFMFLHCVALNRAEVVVPWDLYGRSANRLFWFRVVLSLATLAVVLPVVIMMVILIVRMVTAGEATPSLLLPTVGLGMVLLLLVLGLVIVYKFMTDFVVPIMYLRGGTCLAAWREFCGLLTANPGAFILYLLFQIALEIILGTLIMFVFLLTCCVACCVAMVPYIGKVLLLPILTFKRAYSLYFLAQFGPSYNVFPPATPPAPVAQPPPGLQPL